MLRPKGSKNKPKPLVIEETAQTPISLSVESDIKPLDLTLLVVDKFNMRNDSTINPEFVEDIKVNGVLQPLIVRPLEDGKYGVIVGSRRFYHAQEAKLTSARCDIRELDDKQALSLSISDNMHSVKPSKSLFAKQIKAYCELVQKENPKLVSKTDLMKEVAKQKGLSESNIALYYDIATGSTKEVFEALDSGKITTKQAQNTANLMEDTGKPYSPEKKNLALISAIKAHSEPKPTKTKAPKDTEPTKEKPTEGLKTIKSSNEKNIDDIGIMLYLHKPIENLLTKLTQDSMMSKSPIKVSSKEQLARVFFLEGLKATHLKELEDACKSCDKFPCVELQRIGFTPTKTVISVTKKSLNGRTTAQYMKDSNIDPEKFNVVLEDEDTVSAHKNGRKQK